VQRFRDGLVFKAHILCVSLNSRFGPTFFETRAACGGRSVKVYGSEFRGGLVFKAHRLLYHSTLGLRVIKKKKFRV